MLSHDIFRDFEGWLLEYLRFAILLMLKRLDASITFTFCFNLVDFMNRICNIHSTGACSHQAAFNEGNARNR